MMKRKSQIKIEQVDDDTMYLDQDNGFEIRCNDKSTFPIKLYTKSSVIAMSSLDELNELKNFCRRVLNHQKYFD